MKAFIVLSLVLSTSAFAASKRLITCKGTSSTVGYETFRINILRTEAGELKANLSEGYTTMNTSETWKVQMVEAGSVIKISNINKSALALEINKAKGRVVDDIDGAQGSVNLVHIAKPYMAPAVTYTITKGKLACRIE